MKFAEATKETLDGLRSDDHKRFEPALTTLGKMLGADAFKPPGKGRADSAWLFADEWWVTLEVKNEAQDAGLVSMGTVRQTNTQLDLLAEDREEQARAGSASVIVSPKLLVDPDAVKIASSHVYLMDIEEIEALAKRAIRAWSNIRTAARGSEEEAVAKVVAAQFDAHDITATQVREQLTGRLLRA